MADDPTFAREARGFTLGDPDDVFDDLARATENAPTHQTPYAPPAQRRRSTKVPIITLDHEMADDPTFFGGAFAGAEGANCPTILPRVEWRRAFDAGRGVHSFTNLVTGERRWHPPESGVIECRDEAYREFYADAASGKTARKLEDLSGGGLVLDNDVELGT